MRLLVRLSALPGPFCGGGEDEAMYVRETESLAGRKCDASGTKLPSDAGTNTQIHQRKVVGGAILKVSN